MGESLHWDLFQNTQTWGNDGNLSALRFQRSSSADLGLRTVRELSDCCFYVSQIVRILVNVYTYCLIKLML